MHPHLKSSRGTLTSRDHLWHLDLIKANMPVTSRLVSNHLPALAKANNYSFYSDNSQYDLRKMYEEWRGGLSHHKVPRLCRLDQHEALARLPALPEVGTTTKRRLSQHSASSPPTCRVQPIKKVQCPPANQHSYPVNNSLKARPKICVKPPTGLPDKRVGRFQCLSKIGQGSYGNVFKCRDRETDTVVAIKRFLQTEDNANIRKIAYREIRILKQVRHRHIVTLLEVFRRKKRIHLVFEYCDRTLLDEIQRSKTGISERTVQRMMGELLRAILVVHQHRCIHRDVKPENILLTQEGTIKLCDFGFARSVTPIHQENDQFTDYVATRWYRAPELLLGKGLKYGSSIDIWAMGCVFYECITRQPLFPGTTDIDQLYLIEKMFGKINRQQTNKLGSLQSLNSKHNISSGESTKFPVSLDIPGNPLSCEARNILTAILQTNASRRPSANTLLQRAYFAGQTVYDRSARPSTGAIPTRKTKSSIQNMQLTASVTSPNITNIAVSVEPTQSSTTEENVLLQEDEGSQVTGQNSDVEICPEISALRWKNSAAQKLPKMSTASIQSVGSLEIVMNSNLMVNTSQKSKVYALRRSMSRPNFLPTILA